MPVNRGIAPAIEAQGLKDRTILVGHELPPIPRALLQAGAMGKVTSHDLKTEMTVARQCIKAQITAFGADPAAKPILMNATLNCGLCGPGGASAPGNSRHSAPPKGRLSAW